MRLFITSLNSISFNALQLRAQARLKSQNGPMFWMGWRLALEDDLLRRCHVNDYSIFSNFLNELDAGYEHFQAPYHNSAHGAEVMYATNYYLKESGFLDTCKITEHDLFAAMIAAAAHDFRHPGRTNAFLSKAGLEASIFDQEGPDYIEWVQGGVGGEGGVRWHAFMTDSGRSPLPWCALPSFPHLTSTRLASTRLASDFLCST